MFDNKSVKSFKSTSQKPSPVKSKEYEQLQTSKQQIVDKLLYTFTYYAAKASKYAYKQLNEKYFMLLIMDMYQMAGRTLKKNQNYYKDYQNLYYSKGRKHGLLFNDFLQMIPAISVFFNPDLERQEAVKSVIHAITTLYDSRIASELEARLVEYHEPINQQTKQFIIKLYPSLAKIYKIYFPQQISNKFNSVDPQNQSFESYMNLMKEFQVFPKFISASSLYFLYNQTLKAQENNLVIETEYIKTKIQDIGQMFTLSKFVQILVSTSRICLPKLKHIQNPQYDLSMQKQTLKILLEYMETIKSTKTKQSNYKQHRFSFIVYQQYPEEVMLKTFLVKDRIVKEVQKDMDFYAIFGKMKI